MPATGTTRTTNAPPSESDPAAGGVEKADGTRSSRLLLAGFGMNENKFFDELRLLVRTRWIAFASGEAEFERWVGR